MKRNTALLILLFCAGHAVSQGLTTTPIQGAKRELPSTFSWTAYQITDTISLPFFDDFTTGGPHPDSRLWCESQVYVNNTFSTNQPNYMMATFDHLDENGNPYSVLNKNYSVYADSLTSQPIKLDFYKTGPSTTQNYLPTDSIYLSFFLQRKGIGDAPDAEDSLLLFFLDNTGKWNRVWKQTGGSSTGFYQVTVPVNDFKFLHAAFQFRFVNYTRSTGNLNHWHLDYVRLEKYKKRTGGNDIRNIKDVCIAYADATFLKNYHSMPYAHYKADKANQYAGDNRLTLRNLDSGASFPVQTRFAMEVRNQYGSLVYNFPFAANSQNVSKDQPSVISYPTLNIDTFSGNNPCFTVKYMTIPQSNDGTPAAYNALGDNNEYAVKHCFGPWYAYDDGSAEGGFGLDYAFLGNIKGQFAMKFETVKDDSLRGVAMYFNQSESDVAFRSFYLRIWKTLSPIGQPDNKDVLIYEQLVTKPSYTDSINKFSYIMLDTVLALAKGSYYVGWRQNQPYILNVGYDNNYRYQRQDVGNPNLFHNLLGSWERSDAGIKGTPMIRMMVGADKEFSFQVKNTDPWITGIYPNPVEDILHIQSQELIDRIAIYDKAGRLMKEYRYDENGINIADIPTGNYTVTLISKSGKQSHHNILKHP
ncbi:MAG: T9SS type A sorting domain-containing protein [Bacteroidia bacterium]